MTFGKQKPLIGEQRERLTFAWFPVPLDDGTTAWLTTVRLIEVARMHRHTGGYRPPRPNERGYWSLESAVLP